MLVSGLSTYTFGDRCGSCAGLVASLLTPKIEGFCPNILAAVGDVDAGDFVTRGAKSLPIRGRASISGIRVRLFTRCMASTAEGDIDADMGDKAVGDLGFPPCVLAGRESTNFGEISNEIARRADRPFGPFCTSPGDNPFELDADSNASGLAFAGGFV